MRQMDMVSPPAPIQECPHCGATSGFYTKDYFHGSGVYYYRFDGTEADNSTMYDRLIHKQGKVAYCDYCEKPLFKMEDLEK